MPFSQSFSVHFFLASFPKCCSAQVILTAWVKQELEVKVSQADYLGRWVNLGRQNHVIKIRQEISGFQLSAWVSYTALLLPGAFWIGSPGKASSVGSACHHNLEHTTKRIYKGWSATHMVFKDNSHAVAFTRTKYRSREGHQLDDLS